MKTIGPRQLARRTHLLLVLMGTPTLLTAVGLSALEAWRLRHPESPLFATPFVYSLADAIERDDVQRAYDFIRAGQNPSDLIPVHHPVLTGGRTVLVSPLVWAAAMNSKQAALMLLGFGARMDRATDSQAACLAEALGNAEVADVLRNYGTKPSPPCAEVRTRDRLLLSFVDESP